MDDTLEHLKVQLAGRYDVVRKLGEGGMAAVFLAKDVKHDRDVAIKVLHPELAATIGGERFEREIRTAAKLQHPNILGMFDSGVADGLLYYVMPFIEGESVRDRLDRETQLPVEDAVQIALEVADALGYAHSKGIVHRDIKPENIMLSGGHALVADFGIARAVEEGGAQKLTQTGMALGTPKYMSPEQAVGEVVGPTSDLYSLGCVLYEMLAGEPPFTGKSGGAIMAKHAMEAVPSIRIVRSNVPEEVEQAIFAAMGKVPADRPQTAAQFMEIMGVPVGATATRRVMRMTPGNRTGMTGTFTSTMPVAAVPVWRRPWAVAVAAVVMLGTALGLWGLAGRGGSAAVQGPEARRIAVLYFNDLSKDSSLGPLADGLTEGLIRSLSSATSFGVVSSTGAAAFRGSSLSIDSIARALRAGYVVRGEVEPEKDKLRVSVRLDDASGVNLQRAALAVPSANVMGARDTLVVIVGDLIRKQLGEQFQLSSERASTSSADSWLFVQRGEAARRAMDAAAAKGDTVELDRQYRAADSLFAAAQSKDAKWSEPAARRALIAYRRSRLTRDPVAIRQWVGVGLPHADQSLLIDPDNADALEVRGNLKYWSWLSNLEEDATRKEALIVSAKTDLEKAVAVNRNQAGAYATLSHLYNNATGASVTDVLLAAQRAYEVDEFLSEAELVLSRLVLAAYDLGQFEKADQWCAEAKRRFPRGWRTARCELLLLTTRAKAPDVAAAWRLADSVTARAPNPKFYRLNSDVLVAAVIARASEKTPALADSARRVIRRSEGDETIDPTRDLAMYGAMAAAILGDNAEAIRLLKIHLAVNPHKISGFRDYPAWQFRDLASDPAYRQLVGAR